MRFVRRAAAPMQARPPARARALRAAVLAASAVVLAAPAFAADQDIALRFGWNLISLSQEPADPSPEAILDSLAGFNPGVGSDDALWSYDATLGTWARYPAVADVPTIATLEVGRGYWLHMTAPTTLTIQQGTADPRPALSLYQPGWNLVGFGLEGPQIREEVLRGLADTAITEIWRFSPGGFESYETLSPVFEPFTNLEPGRGYWVFNAAAFPIDSRPTLGTRLPPDTDAAPFLLLSGGGQTSFSPVTPGDINIGALPSPEGGTLLPADTSFDMADTQRAMHYGDIVENHVIGIVNEASGVLQWIVRVEDSVDDPWLRIRVLDEATGDSEYLSQLSGSTTTETDFLEIAAEKRGMAPGSYLAHLRVATNAKSAAFPQEPDRLIPVLLEVETVEGDYEIRVVLDTVNQGPADLPNPRLYLSMYSDDPDGNGPTGTALKAGIDPERSLLYSATTRLQGEVYRNGGTDFLMTGSFTMVPAPPGQPYTPSNGNVFGVEIEREITLVGARVALDDPDPQARFAGDRDLLGDYFEVVRGLANEPVTLRGRFHAVKGDEDPSFQDSLLMTQSGTGGCGNVPLNDPGITNFDFALPANALLVRDVTLGIQLDHNAPSEVRMTLIAPSGETVILRDQLDADSGFVTYGVNAETVEPLSDLRGARSPAAGPGATEWRLQVEDLSGGNTGTINTCTHELTIRGTELHSITGTLTVSNGSNVGVPLRLTGCSQIRTTVTGAGGSYQFDDLVDCNYRISVDAPGYQNAGVDVPVENGAASADPLVTSTQTAPDPIPYGLPEACPVGSQIFNGSEYVGCSITPSFKLATVASNALAGLVGSRQQLIQIGDSSTFDVNRPPAGGIWGGEDTLEFGDGLDIVAQTNQLNPGSIRDGLDDINPDAGNNVRAVVSIGAPVIGTATRADARIAVGSRIRR